MGEHESLDPFLNHDTSFFIGAERIAKQVDAALYYVDVKRVKEGIIRQHSV